MPHERSTGMTLAALQKAGLEGRIRGVPDQIVTGVQHDSRHVEPGDLFVAVPGQNHDGIGFVDDALARGAAAVMAERILERDVAQITVARARVGLAVAAELLYGSPTRTLRTVGITGTNGKTTTAYLLKHAIEADGGKVAFIGTTGLVVGDVERPALHTTPEADDISRFAASSLEAGATHLVLEVSSHGLALHRVDALQFEVAAFTNLSRDHLDFHRDLASYGEAKARLFTELSPKHSVICIDDSFGAALAGRVRGPVIRCSLHARSRADVVAKEWSATRDGIRARVETPVGPVELASPMLGRHNLENLLVALGCAIALELNIERVVTGWQTANGSPGRLERIQHPGEVAVLVDYAHTSDALQRVLDTMRPLTPGRLIVVFGAGGDRDRGKRPEMGRVGAEHADLCVLTSDNPRTEDPQSILAEIEVGARLGGAQRVEPGELGRAKSGYCLTLNRRDAIRAAISAAQPGDTVLLAGKGHETYQIIGSERLVFDDREEARAAIAAKWGGG